VNTDFKPHLTRKQMAQFLSAMGYPVTVFMINKAAHEGTGPRPHSKFGKRYLYTQDAALTWAQSRMKPIVTEAAE
jgi:hypothetical protein